MNDALPDFDQLLQLARTNPQGLEDLRTHLANQVISNAAPAQRRRLEGLQFRINMERRRAATPMAACIRLSDMMNESLANLHSMLNSPELPSKSHQADVVPFRGQG